MATALMKGGTMSLSHGMSFSWVALSLLASCGPSPETPQARPVPSEQSLQTSASQSFPEKPDSLESQWVNSLDEPANLVTQPVTVEDILPSQANQVQSALPEPKPVEIPTRLSLCQGEQDKYDLDVNEARFQERNALSSMWLAKVVQLPDDAAIEALSQIPQNRMRVIRFGGALQAVVIDAANSIIITLRGTQEVSDYLQNSLFVARDGSELGLPGKIHAGFYWNFSQIWQSLENAVFEFGGSRKGVWVTGHSLGGAVGSLAALRFKTMQVPVHGVYEFGSPIAGDTTFADSYTNALGDRTFLIAHSFDITPHVPPPRYAAEAFASLVPSFAAGLAHRLASSLDYKHVGTYFHVDAEKRLQRHESYEDGDLSYWSEMRRTAGTSRLPLLFLQHSKYLTDHDATAYYCDLKKALRP